MNLALTVLKITAPVFLLAAIGFAWVKLGFEYRVDFVTRLGINLAVPALVFVSLMESKANLQTLGWLALATCAGYLAISAAMGGILWASGRSMRTYLAPLTFGNTGNLGLPICLFAFGEQGLNLAVVILAITSVLSFSIGLWVVAGGGALHKLVSQPLVIASVLGAIFLWQGWRTPAVLTETLSLIGQMAIPLMLLTLGVAVARLAPSRLGASFGWSVLKLVVCAASGVAIATLFGLRGAEFGVLILQLAMPVGVSAYLLAEKYGAGADAVAGLVVTSTLLSVLALPLILAFVI